MADSKLWNSVSQTIWGSLGASNDDTSTMASSDYHNPLRRCRKYGGIKLSTNTQPEEPIENEFLDVCEKKKQKFTSQKHEKKLLVKRQPVFEQSPEDLDLHLFCTSFTKKVKISDTESLRTVVP